MKEFWRGLLHDNPIFVLALGMCPALAVTTSLWAGLWMGIAVTAVLVLGSTAASLLRGFLGPSWRLPVLVSVVAALVTVADFLLAAFQPAMHRLLGLYVPLIVVNCLVLARAESFATRSTPGRAALDGLGMGLGFSLGLLLLGAGREILGSGQLRLPGIILPPRPLPFRPLLIALLPPGAFFILGILMALWPFGKGEGGR